MAAPADKTIKNLNGKWTVNKSLSDSTDAGLSIQGIGWLLRKGISAATITITVSQYEGPPKEGNDSTDSFTHVDLEQSASGLSSTKETRTLDGVYRPHHDWLFGNVKGKTDWVTLDQVDDAYLKTGWDDEGDGKFLRSYVESQDADWTATQIWGFQTLSGERRYCRNIVIQIPGKADKRAEFRLVYDYNP